VVRRLDSQTGRAQREFRFVSGLASLACLSGRAYLAVDNDHFGGIAEIGSSQPRLSMGPRNVTSLAHWRGETVALQNDGQQAFLEELPSDTPLFVVPAPTARLVVAQGRSLWMAAGDSLSKLA
jgi:hypothetical protein